MNLYLEYWEQALIILERELSELVYNTWINKLEPVSMTEESIILIAPFSFAKDIIESKYLAKIEKALTHVNKGVPLKAKIILND